MKNNKKQEIMKGRNQEFFLDCENQLVFKLKGNIKKNSENEVIPNEIMRDMNTLEPVYYAAFYNISLESSPYNFSVEILEHQYVDYLIRAGFQPFEIYTTTLLF